MAWGGKREGAGRKPGFAAQQAEAQRNDVAKLLATKKRGKGDTPFMVIVKKALEQAQAGDKHARTWLSEFAYGKPIQPTSFVDPNGDPAFVPGDHDRAVVLAALKSAL